MSIFDKIFGKKEDRWKKRMDKKGQRQEKITHRKLKQGKIISRKGGKINYDDLVRYDRQHD